MLSTNQVVAESGDGDNQFVKWETYLFFVLFVVFNFLMEYWRQKALNLFSTMYCVPLFQVSLVVFSVFTVRTYIHIYIYPMCAHIYGVSSVC